jgi:hypothetical protein
VNITNIEHHGRSVEYLAKTRIGAYFKISHSRGLPMKARTTTTIFLPFIIAGASALAAQAETPIPRSVAGDKGKYFLLESKRDGSIMRALHKRVGVDSIGYTKTETNCATMQMRELGYSEESPSAIKENPTKWFELVPGSSKSDLANFVCK